MYEVQCPNCGIALVVSANTQEELNEFFANHTESGLDFDCPKCQNAFKGLCAEPKHNVGVWNVIIDKDGCRFNYARERLDKLFEDQRQPGYLPKVERR